MIYVPIYAIYRSPEKLLSREQKSCILLSIVSLFRRDLLLIRINVLVIITELKSSNFFEGLSFPFLMSCIADQVGDVSS